MGKEYDIRKLWEELSNIKLDEEFWREVDFYASEVFTLKPEDGYRQFDI